MPISHAQISPNFYRVVLNKVWLYFSYETLIAVRLKGSTYITNEKFSKTTSKHQNYLKNTFANSGFVLVDSAVLEDLLDETL